MCQKISASVDGERAEGLACADSGARTPIGASGTLILLLQSLGGEIEDISCTDLNNLDYELYFLILQKLKEKAKFIEQLTNETDDISHLEK